MGRGSSKLSGGGAVGGTSQTESVSVSMERELAAVDETIDKARVIGRDRGIGTYSSTTYYLDGGQYGRAEIKERGNGTYEAIILDRNTDGIVGDVRADSLREVTKKAKEELKFYSHEIIYQNYRSRR